MTDLKWSTAQRKISDLIPFEGNPRQMTDAQAGQLKASLEKFDLVEIPAVNMNGKILAGHMRIRIMQALGRGQETIDIMIARVFPTKTSLSPTDEHAYFDAPDMFTPNYDEIHISVTFTWDIPKAELLAREWSKRGKVRIGGVAINGESREPFKAGMYLKPGVTITSRGCPNRCSFCQVIKGEQIEFDDFPEGNIVNDNNILACSDRHWARVVQMLRRQRRISFMGGLEANRLTQKRVEDLRSLRINEMFFACDTPGAIRGLERVAPMLRCFRTWQLRCYVMVGKDMAEEESRLRRVYELGFLPFAQLYRDRDNSIQYSKEWKSFVRTWSRPAAYKTMIGKERAIIDKVN